MAARGLLCIWWESHGLEQHGVAGVLEGGQHLGAAPEQDALRLQGTRDLGQLTLGEVFIVQTPKGPCGVLGAALGQLRKWSRWGGGGGEVILLEVKEY